MESVSGGDPIRPANETPHMPSPTHRMNFNYTIDPFVKLQSILFVYSIMSAYQLKSSRTYSINLYKVFDHALTYASKCQNCPLETDLHTIYINLVTCTVTVNINMVIDRFTMQAKGGGVP